MKISISSSSSVGYLKVGRNSFIDAAKKAGAEHLGAGMFGIVLTDPHHPDRALKISQTHQGASIEWLIWCLENPNKYVPKVYSIDLTTDGSYVANMERFESAEVSDVREFFAAQLDGVLVPGGSKWILKAAKIKQIKDLELKKVLEAIHSISKHSRSDISYDNMMMRNQQVVFVDPVV